MCLCVAIICPFTVSYFHFQERLLEAGYRRNISEHSNTSFWPSFILGDTLRIVFQNLLLESNDEILKHSERVWRLLVQVFSIFYLFMMRGFIFYFYFFRGSVLSASFIFPERLEELMRFALCNWFGTCVCLFFCLVVYTVIPHFCIDVFLPLVSFLTAAIRVFSPDNKVKVSSSGSLKLSESS